MCPPRLGAFLKKKKEKKKAAWYSTLWSLSRRKCSWEMTTSNESDRTESAQAFSRAGYWCGELVSSGQMFSSEKTSQRHHSMWLASHFMHTQAPNVLFPATNMSIEKWYNKAACGRWGFHYWTNELSPWRSDLSANGASRPRGGECAPGSAGDEGPARGT